MQGFTCGSFVDSCGNTQQCGTCAAGTGTCQTAAGSTAGVCGGCQTQAQVCRTGEPLPACGDLSLGTNCGSVTCTCPPQIACQQLNGSNQPGVCECVELTAAAVCGSSTCGTAPDGCGGTVSCGTCNAIGSTCTIASGSTNGTCTMPCPPNEVLNANGFCVSDQCNGLNGSGPDCDATQTAFLIQKGPDCLNCLINGDCIDNAAFSDTGKDCDDLTGNATGGARAGQSNAEICLDKLSCILSTSCASSDVNVCYCGTTLGGGNACATASTPGTGACAQQEVDGSNHLITDPASKVLPDLANQLLPAGLVDQIFVCAHANQCDALCSQ